MKGKKRGFLEALNQKLSEKKLKFLLTKNIEFLKIQNQVAFQNDLKNKKIVKFNYKYPKILFTITMKPKIDKLEKRINILITKYYNQSKQSLKLDGCDLRNDGVKLVFEIMDSKLLSLELVECNFNYIGFASFITVDMSKLLELTIRLNNIGNNGLKILSKANLPNLKILCLTMSCFGDQGVRHLTKAHFPNLSRLWIPTNKIRLSGYLSMQLFQWDKIVYLSILQENIMGIASMMVTELKKTDINCWNKNKQLNKILLILMKNRFCWTYPR